MIRRHTKPNGHTNRHVKNNDSPPHETKRIRKQTNKTITVSALGETNADANRGAKINAAQGAHTA